MLLVKRPVSLAKGGYGMDDSALAFERAGRSVVTVQARLLRYRYPIAGVFVAGRRARRCAACGLA